MTQRIRSIHRRGIATFWAVAMTAMVGFALASLSLAVASEHRRTKAAASEAQLRQLLLAGEAWLLDELDASRAIAGGQAMPIPAVDALADATVSVRPVENGVYEVIAAHSAARSIEQIQVSQDGESGGWRIAERHLIRLR